MRTSGGLKNQGVTGSVAGKSGKAAVSGETLAAAELLSDYLDTRVSVQGVTGKGKIVIEFAGREDLQRIVDLIEGK